MIRRPKPGEDEEDLLRMQEEYLREKSKDPNYKPAAQVTSLRPTEPVKRTQVAAGTRKQSKYAQSKGLTAHSEKRARTEASTSSVMGDILEKNLQGSPKNVRSTEEDDKVYFPTVLPSVLGNIVEKNLDVESDNHFKPMPSKGFPAVTKRDPNIVPVLKNLDNIQLQNSIRLGTKMEVDEAVCEILDKQNLPQKSYIVTSKDANDIHNENLKLLSSMSEKEILEERQKLMTNLDPKLVEFIKSRRQEKHATSQDLQENKIITEKMESSMPSKVIYKSPETLRHDRDKSSHVSEDDSLWDNDVLSHPQVNQWLHFDSLEKDKLEWMKGIEKFQHIKPDEPYEARFDFKGYLLPYTLEYTEKTKPLFHHGEEPHRPGYTLTELIELSRSAVTQQRVLALNTLAGILEYYSAGTYKDVIELPLSKIFFIIRIAMDDNKVIILEPALRAMRNLLYNRIDEASLDALIGFEEGTVQPCLENDKSEIDELESKESELKDFHLAEIDLISAILRTDILQRLYYILDAVRPTFNCVQYALQILTRLARDSVDTAMKIVQSEYLIKTIIKNFLPTTSVNFVFDPQMVYKGKPILTAVRLLRILSLQDGEISLTLLNKYNILEPICSYISSGVDRTYGLRVQIEAHCLLSNMLYYGLGVEAATSLLPVVITTLYKHVKGTDIFITTSIMSATHAAVVIQLINRLLNINLPGLDNYKAQIYPLLKEGMQKWIAQFSQADSYTCAHLRLLCAVIDCSKTIMQIENIPIKILNDSLKQLPFSKGFQEIIKNLIPSSNLLSGLDNKNLHLTKNLMSLGGSVVDCDQKVLPILTVTSPVPFLTSLIKLLTYVNDKTIAEGFLHHLTPYLKKLSKQSPALSDNWFTRMETDLVFNILKLGTQTDVSETDKDLLYIVANKLCYILRTDKRYEVDYLFRNIVFNKDWFTAERLFNLVSVSEVDGFSKVLTSMDEIRQCYSKTIKLNYRDTGPNIVLLLWREPILPRDWIYLPILVLYSKRQDIETTPIVVGENAKRAAAQEAAEKEMTISCTLEWILFNEMCFPDLISDMHVTDRFCRIMCVFVCDNSIFLDAKIKVLLQKCALTLFKKKTQFNFDRKLVGLHNFQDFYTEFLEQFQSVSYGDPMFAAWVLVPLAQKHNVKWRKLIWSEYAGCLRTLDCPEELLCYELKEYLYPEETDESLIKSYHRALSSNLLRPDTIAHKIAKHHVERFRLRSKPTSN